MRAAPPVAPALLGAALLCAGAAAAQVPAGTADRYGYAPPDAQTPMRLSAAYAAVARPGLRGPAAAPAVASPVARPALRRTLDWPGKAAGPSAAPLAEPALRAPAALRTPASTPPPVPPAQRRAAWTPRARAPAPVEPTYARAPVAYAAPVLAPAAGAPASLAPTSSLEARRTSSDATTLGPPRHPWTERWGDGAAAAAPGGDADRGVGPSLQPAPPAAPQPGPVAYAPGAAAAPVRTAQASGGTARYYSLHKPYGHEPDPAPIPPQFFGPTADLSTPETSEPARATLTANPAAAHAAVNAARLSQGATD